MFKGFAGSSGQRLRCVRRSGGAMRRAAEADKRLTGLHRVADEDQIPTIGAPRAPRRQS